MASHDNTQDLFYNVNDGEKNSLKDMPSTVIVYRLSVYFSLCLTVSSLYLPVMKSPHSPRRNRHVPVSLSMGPPAQRSTDRGTPNWNQLAPVYNVFSKAMSRHAGRHKNDQAFVQHMFRLFDLNKDRVIGYKEFKAVLKILQIVSHNI